MQAGCTRHPHFGRLQGFSDCNQPTSLMVSLSNDASASAVCRTCRTTQSAFDMKIIVPFIHAPKTWRYPFPRPSRGNCFRSRSKWEKDRRLRWRVTGPLSGEVPSKGSPAGTMTGVCWTSTSKGRFRRRMCCYATATRCRGLPSGTDGIKNRRTGGLRIAFILLHDALRRPPVFPTISMARLEMRAWQGTTARR